MGRGERLTGTWRVARIGAATLVLLGAALCAGCTLDNPGPMWAQTRYSAYRTSDFFLDGRAMQPPVPGTVPQERARGSEAFETGRSGGRWVERIPMPITLARMREGQHDYNVYCGVCHGLLADSRTPVARAMALRPPPVLQDVIPHAPDGQLFAVISQGTGLMPDYAAEIPIPRRWAVVAYLRALVHSQHARLSDVPAEVRGRLERRR